MDIKLSHRGQSSGLPDWPTIFDAMRRADEPGDTDPGPIRITSASEVPQAIERAKSRRSRWAPDPATIDSFALPLDEVRE